MLSKTIYNVVNYLNRISVTNGTENYFDVICSGAKAVCYVCATTCFDVMYSCGWKGRKRDGSVWICADLVL